jgi:alginate O-acetyltransferase complex protein AlgI
VARHKILSSDMLFNSPEFIFLFLPAAVVLHFLLARFGVVAAAIGTTAASLAFYAWWNPAFLPLPVLSIAFNYVLARQIVLQKGSRARAILIVGIVANVLVLCYFKYLDFILSIFDGRTPAPPRVPLALSFTTFVQIAFLVEIYRRRKFVALDRYALFVSFFPHLIAGPIVRWGSFGSQINDDTRYRLDWNNVALGLTIFVFGLAKKVIIADPLSPHVGVIFDAAARGEAVTTLAAWLGCIAFTLQIYFDFSGYSDMAVGLGLLFNYRLPINFAAPLRATSISDLWRRWHITLARLCRDLIYVPLARGSGLARRWFSLWLTMVVVGIWHGAGWTFVLWGAVQGVLLLMSEAWRHWRGPGRPNVFGQAVGWVLTFGTFTAASSLFRGANVAASWNLIRAMAGFPQALPVRELPLEWDLWGIRHGFFSEPFILSWFGNNWSMVASLLTLAALAVALLLPEPMELYDYREGDPQSNWRRSWPALMWRPGWAWMAATAVVFVVAFGQIGRVAEFLYYQF